MLNSSYSGWLCYTLKRKLANRENPLTRYWDFTRNKPKPNCPNKEYIQKIILDKQTELQQRMLEFNSEQKEYTTTTLLNDENKRFELKTVCQFYQEQIEQCKVLCK